MRAAILAKTIFTIPVIGMVISFYALAAEVRYKSASLRDPFMDISDEKPQDDTAKNEAALRAFQIQGIIISGIDKRAIINGSIYKVGAKIGVGEIRDIDQGGVTVLYNEKEIRLQYIKRNPSNDKKTS